MTLFLHLGPSGDSIGIWRIEPGLARRIDGSGEIQAVADGQNSLDAVKSTRPTHQFIELSLSPGQFYPRMSRPSTTHPKQSPGTNPDNNANASLIEVSRGQLEALVNDFKDVTRIVHPSPSTFNTYGHGIRNLLLLAAMEVESHWRAVLAANGISAYSTNEYIKLLPVMKLDHYAISFPHFPWLAPIKPFANWDPSQPTKSLPWYSSYNSVKHDRENHFEQATLEHALTAMSGCAVMLFAQFGSYGFKYRESLTAFFELTEAPTWDFRELYIPAHYEGGTSTPTPFPF